MKFSGTDIVFLLFYLGLIGFDVGRASGWFAGICAVVATLLVMFGMYSRGFKAGRQE